MDDGTIFTPQQLMGHVSFSETCLVGNWQEDRVAHETRLKDFVAKKETGKLSMTATSSRFSPQLVPVELTAADLKGPPHYGDVLLVRSLCNDGVLALSLADVPSGLLGEHNGVYCAPSTIGAVARSAFSILSYENKSGPVCYDDKVVLVSAGGLHGDSKLACLSSTVPSMGSQSSDQRVTLDVIAGPGIPYEAVWKILPARFDQRLGSLRQPIGPDDSIIIVHAQSGKRLAGLPVKCRTDFGIEHEVSCLNTYTKGTVHQLVGERLGTRHLTGYGVKPEFEENKWRFVRSPAAAVRAPLPPGITFDYEFEFSVASDIAEVRKNLTERPRETHAWIPEAYAVETVTLASGLKAQHVSGPVSRVLLVTKSSPNYIVVEVALGVEGASPDECVTSPFATYVIHYFLAESAVGTEVRRNVEKVQQHRPAPVDLSMSALGSLFRTEKDRMAMYWGKNNE